MVCASWEVLIPKLESKVCLEQVRQVASEMKRSLHPPLTVSALPPLSSPCDCLAHALDLIQAIPDLRQLAISIRLIERIRLSEQRRERGNWRRSWSG